MKGQKLESEGSMLKKDVVLIIKNNLLHGRMLI